MRRLNGVTSSMARAAIVLACAAVSVSTRLSYAGAVVPAERDHVVSLNGTWRFKLERALPTSSAQSATGRVLPVDNPETFEPFYRPDYQESQDWHDLAVPGNWEMAGYSPATYNNPDNASGFYRLWFTVPAEWAGRQVKVHFDGVQNGAELWCNGQPVDVDEPSWGRKNYHEGGWTAFDADLTPVVRVGEKNLLAIRVTKNTRSANLDSGDYFFLGGVHRPVTLFTVPATHLTDVTVRTRLLDGDKAEVRVVANVAGARDGTTMFVRLQGQPPIELSVGADGRGEAVQAVEHPRLWSAEFPELYDLDVDVRAADGLTIQHTTRKVGIREVQIKDGVLLVNRVPVKLAGVCRHDVHPDMGTAVNEDLWRKDLTLMKAANFNAIRTSHYPYGAGFYDLCDRMGFYVLDELPYCWTPTDDPAMTPAFEQRARETLWRDKNHPSVILWGIGNENQPGRSTRRASQIVHEVDPTRPRLISIRPASGPRDGDAEFDDYHYVTPSQIAAMNGDVRRRAVKDRVPQMLSENPNVWEWRNGADFGGLDRLDAVFDRTWQQLFAAEYFPGSFLWEWQDRAVADKCPTKYYNYDPQTGINYLKLKGLVDGYRNPRPHYYHAKMAQAPIRFDGPANLASDGTVSIPAVNHYSFTDLSLLDTHWQLIAGGKSIGEGLSHVPLAPRTNGTFQLRLPSEAAAAADTLRVDFQHPGGWNVVTYQVPLKPAAAPVPPAVHPIADLHFPALNLVLSKIVNDGKGWQEAVRSHGHLADIRLTRPDGSIDGVAVSEEALLAMPIADVRTVNADVVLDHPLPEDKKPGAATAPSVATAPTAVKVIARVQATYAGGEFSYRIDWADNAKAEIQELGWYFQLPAEQSRFSWHRKAYWSYYPETHIGRSEGTALPDTADVRPSHITRPDAFDFNSTKYDCDWASLTDAANTGLLVRFSSDQRHHVRGDFGPAGTYRLIVNRQSSPPRDFSSDCVRDYFLDLRRGDHLEGRFTIGTTR